MSDHQTPVDYKQVNDAYQDNTSKAITARHGRQVISNASPFFFSLLGTVESVNLAQNVSLDITKAWLDTNGNNNTWFVNGFKSHQADSTFLFENVCGANLTSIVTLAMHIQGPVFTDPAHKFSFYLLQTPPGESEISCAGHPNSVTGFDGVLYTLQLRDVVHRRIRMGGKFRLVLEHTNAPNSEEGPFKIDFRVGIFGHAGWRGYAARFPGNTNNSDRGQDIGGVAYE